MPGSNVPHLATSRIFNSKSASAFSKRLGHEPEGVLDRQVWLSLRHCKWSAHKQ